jgi:hypothetical protein
MVMAEEIFDPSDKKSRAKFITAKVKFWFGKDEPIFNTKDYVVEYDEYYAYIYKKKIKEVV